jgi:antitoxin (DNA-binding transcriptional repressor) of toxin-antitoxin stability system
MTDPTTIKVAEAKAHLSALIDRAAAGEEIVLSRAGRPLAAGRVATGRIPGGDPSRPIQRASFVRAASIPPQEATSTHPRPAATDAPATSTPTCGSVVLSARSASARTRTAAIAA